ncbi:MAG: hypothetical protein ACLRFJ_03525 [Alphaproteobacteria bacterium]
MNTYELNKKIAKIRHNKTNYDIFDVYYHVDGWTGNLRKKLNWACAQLVNQEIDLLKFENITNQVNADVNLNRKCNQKKFIEAKMEEAALLYPNASKTFIKSIAYRSLKNIQQDQYRRNANRTKHTKLYFIED